MVVLQRIGFAPAGGTGALVCTLGSNPPVKPNPLAGLSRSHSRTYRCGVRTARSPLRARNGKDQKVFMGSGAGGDAAFAGSAGFEHLEERGPVDQSAITEPRQQRRVTASTRISPCCWAVSMT